MTVLNFYLQVKVVDTHLAYANNTDKEPLYAEIHCGTKARGAQDNPEVGQSFQFLYATQVKASISSVFSLQVQERRPAGLAASAEPSPRVSGRDLSSQTTRRNGGSTGGNGLVLFHLRSQSSLCWQHTYNAKRNSITRDWGGSFKFLIVHLKHIMRQVGRNESIVKMSNVKKHNDS